MSGCRFVTREEIAKILDAFTGRMTLRDKALFVFGCNTGFRISEILSIRRGDLIDSSGCLCEAVTVKKKNMKGKIGSRNICLNGMARGHLSAWLKEQAARGYMMEDTYVFCANGGRRMDRVTAWRILKRAYRRAGLAGNGLATHTMRKTFANAVYNEFPERDALRMTSRALGHKRIDTTDRYLSFVEQDISEVVKRIGIS